MLPEEETIIVNMMLLQDRMKQRMDRIMGIDEMAKANTELIGFINEGWDNLTEDEKNQVLDRYNEERKRDKS